MPGYARLLTLSWLLLAIGLLLPATIHARDRFEVLTDTWSPYIDSRGEAPGSAARVLEIIAAEANRDISWRYLPYGFAYQLVKREKALLAFPYFKTDERTDEVLFSEAIFSVRSLFYYNRQCFDDSVIKQVQNDLRRLRADRCRIGDEQQLLVGRVQGYSYGEKIDQHIDRLTDSPVNFPSEQAALEALLAKEIHLLPQTEGVMNTMLTRQYPNREQLILPVAAIEDESSLYVIAAKNASGEAAIAELNQALQRLQEMGVSTQPPRVGQDKHRPGMAQLIPAAEQPVIFGIDEDNRQYALPQGTRVIVLEWSKNFDQEIGSDNSWFALMQEKSLVVILNGRLIGKELYVSNVHIELL